MPANTIASASLQITADSTQLSAGLDKAAQKVKGFASLSGKATAGAGLDKATEAAQGAGSGFGAMAVKAHAALAVVQMLGGAIKTVASTIVGALSKAWAETSLKAKELADASRNLGVDTEGLSALKFGADQAGVSFEALRGGIGSFREVMSSASAVSGRVLGQIGLTAASLQSLPIDEQISRVAGSLAAVTNPSERARIALQLFGDKAGELLPLLNRGEAGIREFGEAARRMGLTMNEGDTRQLQEANAALQRMGALFEGIKTQVVLAIAPFVEVAAEAFNDFASNAGNMKETVTTVLQAVARALGYVFDFIRVGSAYWVRYLAEPATSAVSSALTALQSIIETGARLPSALGGDVFRDAREGMREIRGVIDPTLSEIRDRMSGFGKDWRFGDGAKAVDDFFSKIAAKNKATTDKVKAENAVDAARLKMLNGINQLDAKLREEIQTIGMTSGEMEVFKLKMQGATDGMLSSVKSLAAARKDVEAAWSSVQVPPFEMWERKLRGFDTLLNNGRLSWQQYSRGLATAAQEMVNAAGLSQSVKTPSALIQGSKEAVSTTIKARLQDETARDPVAQLRQALIEQKEIQKKQLETGRAIERAIREGNLKTEPDGVF